MARGVQLGVGWASEWYGNGFGCNGGAGPTYFGVEGCSVAVAWDSVALGVRGTVVGGSLVAGLLSYCLWGSGMVFLLGWVHGGFSGRGLGMFGTHLGSFFCAAGCGLISAAVGVLALITGGGREVSGISRSRRSTLKNREIPAQGYLSWD